MASRLFDQYDPRRAALVRLAHTAAPARIALGGVAIVAAYFGVPEARVLWWFEDRTRLSSSKDIPRRFRWSSNSLEPEISRLMQAILLHLQVVTLMNYQCEAAIIGTTF